MEMATRVKSKPPKTGSTFKGAFIRKDTAKKIDNVQRSFEKARKGRGVFGLRNAG
jgi:hypothetical protein